jgi:threonine/homoserine/homoserine lactone efflux protein
MDDGTNPAGAARAVGRFAEGGTAMASPIAALVAFVFAAATTPGPTNALASASGANFGYRRSLPFVLGCTFALPALILVVGLGLGQLFKAYPAVHDALKWAGSAYLLYLAWKIATAGRPHGGDSAGRPFTFVEAVLLQWVNPKGWLAAVSALAAFSRGAEHYLADTLLVAGAFLVCILLAQNAWCLFGTAIGRLLVSPRALTVFNVSMGALVAASIALLYV